MSGDKMEIEFLVEEQSMAITLKNIVPKIISESAVSFSEPEPEPSVLQGGDEWLILVFSPAQAIFDC